MATDRTSPNNNVVWLTSRDCRFRRQALKVRVAECGRAVYRGVAVGLGMGAWLAWGLVRAVIVAVLVLLEPVLRCTLVPVALLSFLVTLVFGVLLRAPHYPVWGMLLFSVAALWAYWLYVALLMVFMRGGRG
jgi:hypothetical protein